MKHAKGFTLIEILTALALIGILAAIAIPSYNGYVIRGKLVEATTNLADQRIKLEQSFQDNRNYSNYVDANCKFLPASTQSAISGAKYFTYTCASTATTYTVTAASKANQGLGAAGDYTYTIDESNAKVTTKFAGTALTSNNTCWLMKQGDSC